jgi:hypothetical protein
MIRGGSLFAFTPLVLAGLFGACARVPADVSKTAAPETSGPAAGHAKQDAPPIPSECVGTELSACADVCRDRTCLDWCAGEACVTTVVELHACMGDVEGEFYATNPMPELEFETASDHYGDYERPTMASMDRQFEWEDARFAAIDGRWSSSCQATCVSHLGEDSGRSGYCANWTDYHHWPRLVEPPRPRPQPRDDAMAVAAFDDTATLGMLSALAVFGSSMSVAELPSHPHAQAFKALIGLASSKLFGIEQCVPDLGDETREFIAELRVDPGGSVADVAVQGGSATTAECIAAKLASVVTLPVRVAREFPRFNLRVEVRPSPFGTGVLDSMMDGGALGGDVLWGGDLDGAVWGGEGIGGASVGGGGAGDIGGGSLGGIRAKGD